MYRASVIGFLSLFLTACVTVDAGPSQDEKASDINVQLGVGYYQQNNMEMAQEKLLKALRQNPDNSQAHYAFAVLQNRFKDKEKAEFHFRKAIELDSRNSEALNNFGAFLCNEGRVDEAEDMFMRAVDNPVYKTPEIAYTNAAVCLLKTDQPPMDRVRKYLTRALAIKNNYAPALINMAELSFNDHQYDMTRIYLERLRLMGKPTARSLWLEIRNELENNNKERADELAEILKSDFADSAEYQAWLALDND
jgi:type IV pilus assembly protein PilF